jgi:Tol biopolymer transport system component
VNGWPAWSPDGRWIAVTANLDGASYNGMEILIISADGDTAKLQWLADHQLEFIHTSGDRLTWR